MTNNDSMLNLSRKSRLSAEVGFLMLKGAGYAAILFFGVWIAIGLMGWFGNNFLPAESRDTRDPQSQAFRDFAERGRAPSAEAFDVVPEVTDAAADAEERLEDGAMADEATMDEAAPVGDDEMAPATAEEADEAAMDEAAPVGDDEMAPATA
ncbi:MAG: RC-LH1 core complex protein PufX, partial [Rubellimicrobium sp.]|nr:RC-LH1 core complex protein PufX [Rubellimicrobium sp.]